MRILGCVALVPLTLFAQSFEIADVHVSEKGWTAQTGPTTIRQGRYEIRGTTMLNLIRTAWAIDADKIFGGPNWLELDKYDVIAKVPDGATADAQRLMLQDLLRTRFGLAIHNDTRPLPSWVLTAAKKHQLKEADGTGETGCKLQTGSPQEGGVRIAMQDPDGKSTTLNLGPGFMLQYQCRNITMAEFASGLRSMRGVVLLTPVSDETGLKSKWNFDVKWSMPIIAQIPGTADRIKVTDALEKQLGLKLEQKPAPQSVLIVDRLNRTPSENPANIAEALPPVRVPTEFEVADVKVAEPGGRPAFGMRMQPGGRFVVESMPLRFLIVRAFNLPNDQITGVPAFADHVLVNITAKAPEGTATGPGLDLDLLAPMIRALLAERFGLKYHAEDRSLPAYSLIAGKPRMKKADPDSRIYCRNAPPAPDSTPGIQTLNCQNASMDLLASRLQAPGITLPVMNATGLDGGWDFTLSYNQLGGLLLNPGRGGDPSQGLPDAPDPSAGNTIFEAVEKQLGLKLESRKRQLQVFVIDHMDAKPTEN
jgi:uncharacterized protein (TIGR03435 family)